jgi:hypothetical protein
VSNNFILEFTKHLKEAGANNIIISPTHPAILLIKEGKLMIELISYNDIQNNKLITFPNIPCLVRAVLDLSMAYFIRICL